MLIHPIEERASIACHVQWTGLFVFEIVQHVPEIIGLPINPSLDHDTCSRRIMFFYNQLIIGLEK